MNLKAMNKMIVMKNITHKLRIGFIALLLIIGIKSFAQSEWKVDIAKAKIINPVTFADESIKEGKSLFQINCKSCHGDPGKDNGLPLIPKPTDMANVSFLSANSDGSIYAKITEGRVTMPSFKTVLSETQRWQIVNYIRSLDGNKKAVTIATVIKKEGQSITSPYKISLTYNSKESNLIAFVEGTSENGSFVPISDVEVGFYIKRYFGNLPFGEKGGKADENGMIKASIPIDLPSGEEGKATAFAKLSDVDSFGEVLAEIEVKVKAVEIVNLLDKRSLWTVRAMAPWWLIFTYFGIIIAVWATLGYVVIQLFKIKKEGI